MIPVITPTQLLELQLKQANDALAQAQYKLTAAEDQARMNYLRWQSAETELKALKAKRS